MHELWWGCIGHNDWFWYWPSLQEVLQTVWYRHPDLATIWWWEWWASFSFQVLIWVRLFGRCGGCNLQFFNQALCSSSRVLSWPWQNGYMLFHSRQPPNIWILQPILCSSSVWFQPIASSAILQEHTEATGRYQWSTRSRKSFLAGIRSSFPLFAWLDKSQPLFDSWWQEWRSHLFCGSVHPLCIALDGECASDGEVICYFFSKMLNEFLC